MGTRRIRRAALLGLGIGVSLVCLLWLTSYLTTPKHTTLDEVEAEARSGGYRLITTEDLAKRIQEAPDSLMVVDTRQEWEYAAGHVKGAENFPMEPTVWARYSKKAPMEQFLGSDKNRVIVFS